MCELEPEPNEQQRLQHLQQRQQKLEEELQALKKRIAGSLQEQIDKSEMNYLIAKEEISKESNEESLRRLERDCVNITAMRIRMESNSGERFVPTPPHETIIAQLVDISILISRENTEQKIFNRLMTKNNQQLADIFNSLNSNLEEIKEIIKKMLPET